MRWCGEVIGHTAVPFERVRLVTGPMDPYKAKALSARLQADHGFETEVEVL